MIPLKVRLLAVFLAAPLAIAVNVGTANAGT
jgi:hypothetical protein